MCRACAFQPPGRNELSFAPPPVFETRKPWLVLPVVLLQLHCTLPCLSFFDDTRAVRVCYVCEMRRDCLPTEMIALRTESCAPPALPPEVPAFSDCDRSRPKTQRSRAPADSNTARGHGNTAAACPFAVGPEPPPCTPHNKDVLRTRWPMPHPLVGHLFVVVST